jgi:hypothetical protein
MWCVVEECEHDDGHYKICYYFKSKKKAKAMKKRLYKEEYDKYMGTNDGNYDEYEDPENLFIELINDRVYDYVVHIYKIKTED